MSYISLGFPVLVVFDRLGTWALPVITMYFYVFEQFRSPRSFGALQALEFDCIYLDFNWITSLHLLGTPYSDTHAWHLSWVQFKSYKHARLPTKTE